MEERQETDASGRWRAWIQYGKEHANNILNSKWDFDSYFCKVSPVDRVAVLLILDKEYHKPEFGMLSTTDRSKIPLTFPDLVAFFTCLQKNPQLLEGIKNVLLKTKLIHFKNSLEERMQLVAAPLQLVALVLDLPFDKIISVDEDEERKLYQYLQEQRALAGLPIIDFSNRNIAVKQMQFAADEYMLFKKEALVNQFTASELRQMVLSRPSLLKTFPHIFPELIKDHNNDGIIPFLIAVYEKNNGNDFIPKEFAHLLPPIAAFFQGQGNTDKDSMLFGLLISSPLIGDFGKYIAARSELALKDSAVEWQLKQLAGRFRTIHDTLTPAQEHVIFSCYYLLEFVNRYDVFNQNWLDEEIAVRRNLEGIRFDAFAEENRKAKEKGEEIENKRKEIENYYKELEKGSKQNQRFFACDPDEFEELEERPSPVSQSSQEEEEIAKKGTLGLFKPTSDPQLKEILDACTFYPDVAMCEVTCNFTSQKDEEAFKNYLAGKSIRFSNINGTIILREEMYNKLLGEDAFFQLISVISDNDNQSLC